MRRRAIFCTQGQSVVSACAYPFGESWSGQYHIDAQTGIEFITATWLLTRMTAAADSWQSTYVSMDFFFRNPPTPEMVETARRVGKAASYLSEPLKPAV